MDSTTWSRITICLWFLSSIDVNIGQVVPTNLINLTSVLHTPAGKIQGRIRRYDGRTVKQFLGIPFAVPPVGDLRFRKPQALQPWNQTLMATEFRASCMQYFYENDEWLMPNLNKSEDCLQLNIFVPNGGEETKAVMLWIHGGGFTAGQATLFDASYLALQGDVIVVTTNYRLGLFGFLSTEDSHARGNYGLWDQVMAIKWVHDNIKPFGGDINNVCIFGESAGGYSVGLHTAILQNKGRIRRAISESGALLSPRALSVDSRKVAKNAARLLNCSDISTNQHILQCLREASAEDLLSIQNNAWSDFKGPDNFLNRIGPVIDGDLIPDDPIQMLANRQSNVYKMFRTLDIMAGTNNAEGGLMYWKLMGYQEKYNFSIADGVPRAVLCSEMAKIASYSYYNNSGAVTSAVCNHYDVPGGSLADIARSTSDVYADLQFIVPTVKTLDSHSEGDDALGRSYQYVFTHQPSFSWIRDRPGWLRGMNHAGELAFVFGLDAFYPPDHDRPLDERRMSQQVMTYWSNFAKTGNPNGADETAAGSDNTQWPHFSSSSRRYMNLTLQASPGLDLFSRRVKFWTETVPAILNNPAQHRSLAVRTQQTLPMLSLPIVSLIMCLVVSI